MLSALSAVGARGVIGPYIQCKEIPHSNRFIFQCINPIHSIERKSFAENGALHFFRCCSAVCSAGTCRSYVSAEIRANFMAAAWCHAIRRSTTAAPCRQRSGIVLLLIACCHMQVTRPRAAAAGPGSRAPSSSFCCACAACGGGCWSRAARHHTRPCCAQHVPVLHRCRPAGHSGFSAVHLTGRDTQHHQE